MENSLNIVKYLRSINTDKFKSRKLIKINGLEMYEGEFCLYKILYLANIFYYLLNNNYLIDPMKWKKWKNGPANTKIRKYFKLVDKDYNLEDKIKFFLDAINNFFIDASSTELYEITHCDPSYIQAEDNQEIDIAKNIKYYKKEYKEAISCFKQKFNDIVA
ncbi:hypothetical protein [Spiroplasma endosymbiont of Aspidapion aeneum]|uniref:hypothetical protein n=1 Tax=Spiroplasma endosymbiont of Aspidapion aeneum TaxID=3066276 RepID=UPI00313B7229